MQALGMHYQNVVVDVPHQLDAMSAGVLGMARHVLVVFEQSVLNVKNTSKLLRILTKEIGVTPDRIRLVLNRFNRRSNIAVEDIERTLDFGKITILPNHYQLSLDSIDTAKPLFDLDKDAPVLRALFDLQSELLGTQRAPRGGLLSRLPMFTRK